MTMQKASRFAAFLAALLLSGAAFAQTFGTDKRIYPHAVASISINPTVAVSGNNVYLAWSTFSTANSRTDVFVSVSTNNGDTFSVPVNVSAASGKTRNIQPVIAGDGANVHVFWTDDESGENPAGGNAGLGQIFYARSTNNGAGFAAPQSLVNVAGYSRPTSAVVRGAEVHLAFYDNRAVTNAAIAGRVYHMMSCNSGAAFGAANQVTQFDGDVDSENPRLVVSTNAASDIFMVFRSSRGGIPFPGHPPFQVYLQRMLNTNCPGTASANWLYPVQRLSRGPNVELGGNYGANVFAGASGRLLVGWWNDTGGTNLMFRQGQPDVAGFAAQKDLTEFGLNHLQWTGIAELTGFGLGEDAGNRIHAMFLQNTTTRVGFQAGPLWHRCAPSPGGAFVGKRLVNGLASEPRGIQGNGRFHMVWMDFRFTPNDQAEIFYNHVNTTACTEPPAGSPPVPSSNPLNFGGNSIQTTASSQLQLNNPGGTTVSVSSVVASAGFSVIGHDCASIVAGGNCTITVGFTPTTQGVVNGNLAITYSTGGPGQVLNVTLSGTGELSLVKHFYRAILNRAPEPGGQEFWEAEAARLQGLGANINEVWFVMANYFFNSAEYIAANKTNTQFLTDVYNTFFNRAPDPDGFNFWMSQMNAVPIGLSREGVIFWFMFSPEFRTFTQGIFGAPVVRAEVDMVLDFFRGILNRFPDNEAFNFWVGQLRQAQCQGVNAPGAVYAKANEMSFLFLFSLPEYPARNRDNTQYVSDMYNAFLRRGGTADEVGFWINQLNTGGKDRNTVRADFINSAEFGGRVNNVVNAGCVL